MEGLVIGISIDKKQSFIYEVIHSHQQEKQKEEDTLQTIVQTSHEISQTFFDEIDRQFVGMIEKRLPAGSGEYFFLSNVEEKIMKEELNRLFCNCYKQSSGKKIVKYTVFSAEKYTELGAIKEAKKKLQKPSCLSEIIESNKEVLFTMNRVENSIKREKREVSQYSQFVRGMNDLYSGEEQNKEKPYGNNHFWIAIIKADLDGMGNLFREVSDYSEYKSISELLNQYFCLEGLNKVAQSLEQSDNKPWILPLYIAGDDLFFAVSIANIVRGIDLCRQLTAEINKELGRKENKLILSIGVSMVFNREPIRYYIEQVEEQLLLAKNKPCPPELASFLENKIAMFHLPMLDINYGAFKNEKQQKTNKSEKEKLNKAYNNASVWSFFLKDIALINRVKSDEKYQDNVGSSRFYYTLLEKISAVEELKNPDVKSNNNQYLTQVLYHIRPKYLESSDKTLLETEVYLKMRIISHLYKKGSTEISLDEEARGYLKGYLRWMLLLSDERFQIKGVKEEKEHKDKKQIDKKESKQMLFERSKKTLYGAIRNNNAMKCLIEEKGEKKKPKYYQKVKIEKAMFFKLRDIQKYPVEKAAEMIAIVNPWTEDELQAKRKERAEILNVDENQVKQFTKVFEKEKFIKMASKEAWTTESIDLLMLLYEYLELSAKWGKLGGKKK